EVNNQKKFVFLIAYDPKTPLILDIIDVDAEKGRLLRSGDTKNVLLGYNYLFDNKIFKKGLDINNIIKVDDEKMKIIGFFESVGNPHDDSQVYITNEYFEKLYPNKTYFEIVARVDITNINKVIENIEKKYAKAGFRKNSYR
ncbi:MAG: ABC transporter permease, partial [Bacteroidetes bacterium]|nr:ABC transporter permease [Bacteroidota bacterium]